MWLDASVFLVMCTRRKRAVPCKARELYVSPFFVAARRAIEHVRARWFILSAEHGLLSPNAVVAPYDRSLADLSPEERNKWADRVYVSLRRELVLTDRITLLAEPLYGERVGMLLKRDGFEIETPLYGLNGDSFAAFIDKSAVGRVSLK